MKECYCRGVFAVLFAAIASVAMAQENGVGDPGSADTGPDKLFAAVQEILSNHCLECHGPDKSSSSLRVDSRESLLAGGDYGEASIVPHHPNESFLYRVVSGGDDDLTMPPEERQPLSEQEVATIKEWIDKGAEFAAAPVAEPAETHWSLQTVQSPPIPPLDAEAERWVSNPIDAFVLSRLNSKGLQPSPEADRRTLIRRLYLVMWGLPPSPAEIEGFVADSAPDAWERLVDRVLASPHYGERWARHWLDVVRFGETDGFETNRERPNAWRYRDWVIDAFNSDKPYDAFVKAQIAGDVLGDRVGTGFLVGGPVDIVKSPDVLLTRNQRQDELTDFVNTTGTTFLGLTLGCARCHNHKFDPISQKDFYAMEAIFAGVQHGEGDLPLRDDLQEKVLALESELTSLQKSLQEFSNPGDEAREPTWLPGLNAKENVDVFPSRPLRFLKFVSLKTNSGIEPCLDELHVYSGSAEVGLASLGVRPTSSGDYQGNPKHQLPHINDGIHGNDHSWISNTANTGWVQLEFPDAVDVDRVVWGRDRDGVFSDRLAVEYRIEGSLDGTDWFVLSGSERRLPFGTEPEMGALYVNEENEAQRETILRTIERIGALRSEIQALNQPEKAYVGMFGSPQPIHRLFRGDVMQELEVVAPDAVAALGTLNLPESSTDPERRMALAEWIVDRENPLTARVIVNRIWQYQFGTGFVDTPGDFGLNGTPPSHPLLLDWLAQDLRDNGWSLKRLQRQILLSATWRQSSRPNAEAMKVDAGTRLLWRFPPRRLEAEAIRDSMLTVSGVLDLRRGGPGFSAFEVELENVRHYFPKKSYGPEDWRRMIYQTKVRQEQDSVFGSFDCPDASQIAAKRSRSTTPLQALNLFNSRFVLQQSELLARRLSTDRSELPGQIARAFELLLGREPTELEKEESIAFAEVEGLEAFCRAILNSNEFLFIF